MLLGVQHMVLKVQELLVIVLRYTSGGTASIQRASGIAPGSCAAADVGVAGLAIIYRVSVHLSLLIVQRVQCWADVQPPLWSVLQAYGVCCRRHPVLAEGVHGHMHTLVCRHHH